MNTEVAVTVVAKTTTRQPSPAATATTPASSTTTTTASSSTSASTSRAASDKGGGTGGGAGGLELLQRNQELSNADPHLDPRYQGINTGGGLTDHPPVACTLEATTTTTGGHPTHTSTPHKDYCSVGGTGGGGGDTPTHQLYHHHPPPGAANHTQEDERVQGQANFHHHTNTGVNTTNNSIGGAGSSLDHILCHSLLTGGALEQVQSNLHHNFIGNSGDQGGSTNSSSCAVQGGVGGGGVTSHPGGDGIRVVAHRHLEDSTGRGLFLSSPTPHSDMTIAQYDDSMQQHQGTGTGSGGHYGNIQSHVDHVVVAPPPVVPAVVAGFFEINSDGVAAMVTSSCNNDAEYNNRTHHSNNHHHALPLQNEVWEQGNNLIPVARQQQEVFEIYEGYDNTANSPHHHHPLHNHLQHPQLPGGNFPQDHHNPDQFFHPHHHHQDHHLGYHRHHPEHHHHHHHHSHIHQNYHEFADDHGHLIFATAASTHHHHGGFPSPGSSPGSKAKRRRVPTIAQRRAANIRERRRMYNLNEAFDELRTKVPTFAYEKRLSRIETLRLAMTYIAFMTEVVKEKVDEDILKDGDGKDDLGKSKVQRDRNGETENGKHDSDGASSEISNEEDMSDSASRNT